MAEKASYWIKDIKKAVDEKQTKKAYELINRLAHFQPEHPPINNKKSLILNDSIETLRTFGPARF